MKSESITIVQLGASGDDTGHVRDHAVTRADRPQRGRAASAEPAARCRAVGGRHWLALAGAVVAVISLLPPAETYARRYVFAESLQFAIFAMVVPALIVLGAPWRRVGLPAHRLAMSRRGRGGFLRAAAFLALFAGAATAWRLPAAVDALAKRPSLAVLEMATLLIAGTGLWLEIADSPPLSPRVPRQQCAAVAALALWTVWVIAYLLGFSHVSWFSAYDHAVRLNAVADQEIATILLWAVAAACFIPVVYISLVKWLKDLDDPNDELREAVRAERRRPGVRGWTAPRRPAR